MRAHIATRMCDCGPAHARAIPEGLVVLCRFGLACAAVSWGRLLGHGRALFSAAGLCGRCGRAGRTYSAGAGATDLRTCSTTTCRRAAQSKAKLSERGSLTELR